MSSAAVLGKGEAMDIRTTILALVLGGILIAFGMVFFGVSFGHEFRGAVILCE
ncbi:hypothetical protein W02_17820 [Nitrospira sp. KM1]|uniref:hypothetical protein n=1 Tax=Nitrospira sp. KM1 TaxID=1936990 RepID=UPI0013A73CDE|nr:hypothetical protein [Nitrospira sp. KM1]BCA54642.1 hypothetical protein W02_17820 [Nitrospira sp. KM1]